MASEQYFINEMKALRDELLNLKHCQLTYITFSVTATGMLLGIGSLFGRGAILAIIFLFPLIVLLPAWWVFFDKASSVTRIVGYYRILEQLILDNKFRAPGFVGWENGLREYRTLQDRGKLGCPDQVCSHMSPDSNLLEILHLKTGHRYWIICYFIFLGLSTLCVLASVILSALYFYWPFLIVVLIAVSLYSISAYMNLKLVHKLIHGPLQYNCSECHWKMVLGVIPFPQI